MLASAVACALTGLVVIAAMPWDFRIAGPTALAWGAWTGVELAWILRAYRACRIVTVLADGSVDIDMADGVRRAGRLAPGSLRLRRWAWLCVCLPGGLSWGEPLSILGQDREQWRRFQVICRHIST